MAPPGQVDPGLAARRAAFVSGHNGTTLGENVALGCVGPLSVLLTSFAVPWLFPGRLFLSGRAADTLAKLGLDFLLSVLPSLLAYTVLADALVGLLLVLGVAATAVGAFCLAEYLLLERERPRLRDALRQPIFLKRPMWLAFARANIFISTAVAILAVDLKIFPRRFAKTETYGYGLMDVGVGVFVFINALTAPETRSKLRPLGVRLRPAAGLAGLGLLRLLAVKATGYQQHVSEYGLHWNFFLTLAAIKAGSGLLGTVVPLRRVAWLLGLATGAGYEYALSGLGLRAAVLADDADAALHRQHSLLYANKEGLASAIGLTALHFFGMQFGVFLLRERVRLKEWLRCVIQLSLLTLAFHVATVLAEEHFEPPSRRMANLTYTLWMLAYSCWYLTAYVLIELLVLLGGALRLPLFAYCVVSPFEQLEPNAWRLVSEGGLPFFLAANLLTGLLNLLHVDLGALSPEQGLFLLVCYTAVLLGVAFFLQRPKKQD